MSTGRAHVAAVVIGRNEGERLRRCLASLAGSVDAVVYVDSGSTDGSADCARGMGVEVVELDTSIPFTAARARNTGFARLMLLHPRIRWVQFVDGDCEVDAQWIAKATDAILRLPGVAVVCGRRRERFPQASIYNRLCDIEWDTAVGTARACGGDFMIRRCAFEQVGGFDDGLIAGEEPELCLRLRRAGWRIQRLDVEMTVHDADMHRFSQWWRRAVRSGHAYAEGFWRHGLSHERHEMRPLASIAFWAVILPVAVMALVWPTRGGSLLLLALYPIQWLRIRRRRGSLYASFTLLAKVPQAVGALRFVALRLLGRRAGLIEYKATSRPRASANAGCAVPPRSTNHAATAHPHRVS